MDEHNHVGFKVDELGRMIRKAVNRGRLESGTDPVVVQRAWMIGFLTHHQDEVICQKDLEKVFHMPKSTATDTLNVLENNGLIERLAVEGDARRKRIVLTDKGRLFNEGYEKEIDETETFIRNGITKEELDNFFYVLDKMKENAANYKKGQEEK